MLNEDIYRDIGKLKAKCEILEARVASLTAFTCALIESHPSKDVLLTKWANNLGPALHEIGPGLGEAVNKIAASVPGWVQHQLNEKNKQ
jgi:hypothetical protein